MKSDSSVVHPDVCASGPSGCSRYLEVPDFKVQRGCVVVAAVGAVGAVGAVPGNIFSFVVEGGAGLRWLRGAHGRVHAASAEYPLQSRGKGC